MHESQLKYLKDIYPLLVNDLHGQLSTGYFDLGGYLTISMFLNQIHNAKTYADSNKLSNMACLLLNELMTTGRLKLANGFMFERDSYKRKIVKK